MNTLPVKSFINKFEYSFGTEHLNFNVCDLKTAIENSCLAEGNKRKVLALYFHNEDDTFSSIFCEHILNEEIKFLLETRFYFLGWDIGTKLYSKSFVEMLNEYDELKILKQRIENKTAGLFLIIAIDNIVTVFSVLQNKVSLKDMIQLLVTAADTFQTETESETYLSNTCSSSSQEEVDSERFQQLMFDLLGDRDYDAFENTEHEFLKDKIGFAFFGPPIEESGKYADDQQKKINQAYQTLCRESKTIAEHDGKVIVSFVYNCLEPLPKAKEKKKRKEPDYNPHTDILPLPLFVLRKCVNASHEPCRIFIDHNLRVYNSWTEYITENKLDEFIMVLPKNGRYQGDENGKVLLENHLTPACGVSPKILLGLDVTSTIVGLVSGGVFAASVIPAITVMPVILIGAGVAGASAGMYGIIRSSMAVRNRKIHKEDMSFFNSEARACYINILAGTLGFAGAGATLAVSRLVTEGVYIAQASSIAVDVLNVTAIGSSGLGIANSLYETINRWRDGLKPSMLSVVQLTSSILFFGNAVYNFKTVDTIIEQSQTGYLQKFLDSLRSNRHRKTFNILELETIARNGGDRIVAGNREVIATVKSLPKKDEIIAVLTRSNKLFNQEQVRFAASGDKVTLNGVPVDILDLPKPDQSDLLINLQTPIQEDAGSADVPMTEVLPGSIFKPENISYFHGTVAISGKPFSALLKHFSVPIREKIITLLKRLLNFPEYEQIFYSILHKVCPEVPFLLMMFNLILKYFEDMAIQYLQNLKNGDKIHDSKISILESVITNVCSNKGIEGIVRDLLNYCLKWIVGMLYYYETAIEDSENKTACESRRTNVRKAIKCKACGGSYFSKEQWGGNWNILRIKD